MKGLSTIRMSVSHLVCITLCFGTLGCLSELDEPGASRTAVAGAPTEAISTPSAQNVDEATPIAALSGSPGEAQMVSSPVATSIGTPSGTTLSTPAPGAPVEPTFVASECAPNLSADSAPVLGAPCNIGQCAGNWVCGRGADYACQGPAEACNGFDDDCDGILDEGDACGDYIEDNCQVWLGWRQGDMYNMQQEQEADAWSSCPERDEHTGPFSACTSSMNDGDLHAMAMPSGVFYALDTDDKVGISFRCDDSTNEELADWIETRCQVFVGIGADFPANGHSAGWNRCPEGEDGDDMACVGSAGDGQFYYLTPPDLVTADTKMAAAFACTDLNEPKRAASLQASAEVMLGWSSVWKSASAQETADNTMDCYSNAAPPDRPEGQRCLRSAGDGEFHHFTFDETVRSTDTGALDSSDVFFIGLRALKGDLPRIATPTTVQ